MAEANDVFGDNTETIVDCDVLEAAKENIQPIAKGRRVTALSALLSTPHAQRDGRLTAAKNRHRMNVEIALEDEDDDPLEAYCRFVNWTVESYPQGQSAESGLLELLEEATRILRNDRGGKWKDDIRYLKLWVLYASYVEKPAIIFKFCMVNEIGTTHAPLYEEFALALEKAGRKTEADETYLVGIARKAQPLDRLEAKHREFQKRMMSSISSIASAPPNPAPAPASSSSSATRRAVLGEAPSSSRTRGPSSTTRSVSSSLRKPQEDVFRALPASSSAAPPRPNGRMQIFVDPTGEESPDSAAAPWPELGTRKSRVKENVMEASKASGTTLKQAGKSKRTASGSGIPKLPVYVDPGPDENGGIVDMAPPTTSVVKKSRVASGSKSSISIFRDEPEEKETELVVPSTPKFMPFVDEEAPSSPSSHGAVPGTVMKDKHAPSKSTGISMSSEAEALRKDPLKNYQEDERVVVLD